jgi:GMP synthase-like glutamine amidotransferase
MTETRVGLLSCGRVKPDFRHLAGDYPDMFESLLGDRLHLRHYSLVDGVFPESATENDGWIITGSPASVYDDVPWIVRLADLTREIVDAGVPLMGICFGHQMIAHALGGTVARAAQGWGVGVKQVDVTETQPWMQPPTSGFRILNSHQDQVTALPPGARVIGTNRHCPVSALAMGDRVVGLQGHPEFGPGYARELMEYRRGRLIPDEVVEEGLASLASPPDRDLLAGWIVAFLTG